MIFLKANRPIDRSSAIAIAAAASFSAFSSSFAAAVNAFLRNGVKPNARGEEEEDETPQ